MRKRIIAKSEPDRAAAPSRHRNIKSIVLERDRLITEVLALREQGADSKFVTNTQQLLTRWWSKAGWTAREELLKSAEWLLQIERQRARMPSST